MKGNGMRLAASLANCSVLSPLCWAVSSKGEQILQGCGGLKADCHNQWGLISIERKCNSIAQEIFPIDAQFPEKHSASQAMSPPPHLHTTPPQPSSFPSAKMRLQFISDRKKERKREWWGVVLKRTMDPNVALKMIYGLEFPYISLAIIGKYSNKSENVR